MAAPGQAQAPEQYLQSALAAPAALPAADPAEGAAAVAPVHEASVDPAVRVCEGAASSRCP